MGANNKKNQHGRKKKKVFLEFDPQKRKEFLTGFHKRKVQRQKVAKEQLEQQLKEEKKRIKEKIKGNLQDQLKQSYQPLPEVDDILQEDEYETGDVSVKIVELSTTDMAKEQNWVGENRPKVDDDSASADEDEDDKDSETENIPGMELSNTPKKRKPAEKKETDPKDKNDISNFKSKKEINRMVHKHTQISLQKSKVFKTKSRMEKIKNKKQARKEKSQKEKFLKQKAKKRGGKVQAKPSKKPKTFKPRK